MANAQNVSAAKPPIAGAIYVGTAGATLPTDTDTAIDTSVFKDLGYVSSDGITNSTNIESNDVKAWGGDTVLTTITSKDDTYKYTLIESLNQTVLEFVYGKNNVSGDLTTGLSIQVSSEDVPEVSLIIDMLRRNNTKQRICIPYAKISAIDDIVYNDSDATGFGTTLKCTPDASGYTHYEYIKKAQVSG